MTYNDDLIGSKISDLLEQKYADSERDKGVDILTEDDSPKQEKDEKKTKNYKECFKMMMEKSKKPISKMTDNEKADFFKNVKEKCSKSK